MLKYVKWKSKLQKESCIYIKIKPLKIVLHIPKWYILWKYKHMHSIIKNKFKREEHEIYIFIFLKLILKAFLKIKSSETQWHWFFSVLCNFLLILWSITSEKAISFWTIYHPTDLCWSNKGEDTAVVFLSFLLADDDNLGLDFRLGDLLDFLRDGDGDNFDLITSGETFQENSVTQFRNSNHGCYNQTAKHMF